MEDSPEHITIKICQRHSAILVKASLIMQERSAAHRISSCTSKNYEHFLLCADFTGILWFFFFHWFILCQQQRICFVFSIYQKKKIRKERKNPQLSYQMRVRVSIYKSLFICQYIKIMWGSDMQHTLDMRSRELFPIIHLEIAFPWGEVAARARGCTDHPTQAAKFHILFSPRHQS